MPIQAYYLAHITLFRSKPLSQNTELKLYKTLIWSTLTYGSEAWATTTKETNAHRIFEQKTVRKVNGLVKGEHCRIRTNKKIKDILQASDTVKFRKSLQLNGMVNQHINQQMHLKCN
jgi:hypothetical protein